MDKKNKKQIKVDLPNQIPNQQEETAKKVHHYLNYAMVISAIVLVVVVLTGIWLNRETNFLSRFFTPTPITGPVDEINGQILDPYTRIGVVGADLVSAQTSVHTSGSGNFIFSNVSTVDGIRVTHPGLLRPLVIIPPVTPKKQRLDILFNEQMYMTLVRVLDDEARGQIGNIYAKYLSPNVKNSITEESFIKQYSNVLTPKNVSDQIITIKSMQVVDNYEVKKYHASLSKAVVLTLSLNGQDMVYALQQLDNNWFVVK
jgi:hypothetical protein